MADFFDEYAEVSDEAESSDDDTDSKVKVKKKPQQVISDDDDDDDEEEDDEEKLREEMKDLINDEEEEVEEDDEEDDGDAKRKHESEEEDDQLEDDDYALLEENLGIKVKRQTKRKRIRVLSDEEDSDKDEEKGEEDREAIANELFLENDEDELPDVATKRHEIDLDLEASEEESDVDDFIVDESGQPLSKKAKKKKHIIHSDSALQEAQDIFGVDFDFEEFGKYDEVEDDFEDEYMDDDEGGEGQTRAKKSHKRSTKKSIYDMYEPSDLERYQLTELDNEIRNTDMPERFQLRSIPVTTASEGELGEEAIWIYHQAFLASTVSRQNTEHGDGHEAQFRGRKAPSTVTKIKKALTFMRNQQFEVPFIAFYRKEDVEPELTINDLWKVWTWDEKWSQMKTRKENLTRLFEKMQTYQYEQNSDPEQLLEASVRPLSEDDIKRVREVKTLEELRDVYSHFVLYYGPEVPRMQNAEKIKQLAAETGEDNLEKLASSVEMFKQPTRKTGYSICVDAKLGEVAEKFGLTADQFGENMRDNYQRHDVDQCPLLPQDIAEDYICPQFPTIVDVMKGARHMVSMQIAHDPLVRACVRETFTERAKVKITPTKKGIKEIDENHPCYPIKYIKNKPVGDFFDDQYMKLMIAEADGLVTVTISIDGDDMPTSNYFDEIKQLYHRDEFSELVQQWNNERSEALEKALTMFLYPQFAKEVSTKLAVESQQSVIKSSCHKLLNYLKVAPYQADQEDVDDEDDYDSGLRVLGISFSTNRDVPAFGAMIDGNGEVIDHIRLTHLMNRRNSWQQADRDNKESDLGKLKDFIHRRKPHVIGVMSESRDASMVMEDVKACVTELMQERQMSSIGVELVSAELAHVYANTNIANRDFRDYPETLRQAISIARRLQDPLTEFAQLCNIDDDILCLKFHTLQDNVSKDELSAALSLEFVNRVNEVGVDINAAISHSHTAPLMQFVCGLGPRKASNLIKILKQTNGRLENRAQLVTTCNLGPKVFLNCAGFIKIDTTSISDSTETYVEVLDGSRVHPETYEWARKMAVDALEYDDTAEDANPAGALEEILESPERLKDLDLEAFAEELERQGYGNKHITLYDIRAELNHRYKDLRTPYRPPSQDEVFHMLTKETPETLYIGRMVMCQVIGIAHKRPQGDEMDRAQPVRSKDTGLWQCPFCKKEDLPEISDVWGHFDSGTCPGRAVGVRTRMDNGISGFVPTRMLSDNPVVVPEERVKVGMTVHGRITKIDVDHFKVELTTRSSDLVDKDCQWKPQKDPFYDFDEEDQDSKKLQDEKKQKARQTYIKRVIAHPSFHNIGYKETEKLLLSMETGDVIIRPSSKGADHLTITWKIADGVSQHIDVREDGKENAFSLGRSLWINNEEFEDLDEIIARHIQPMAAFVRDIRSFRVFRSGEKDTIDKNLVDEKRKTPSRIPYFLSMTKDCPPGKFILSYLPRHKPRDEFVTVTPEGLRFRQQMFHSLNSLVRWFKEHYRDPIPGTPAMSNRTPGMGRTPAHPTPVMANTPNVRGTTPRVPANQYKPIGGTPQHFNMPGNFQGGYSGGFTYNQAMNPAMMTPANFRQQFATPAQPLATPSYQPTPRWPGATPRTPAPPRTPASWTPSQQQTAAAAQPRKNASATDWAKAAANWAKNTAKKSGRRRSDTTPVGDGTPLFDET